MVRKGELEGRIEPAFYSPRFRAYNKKLFKKLGELSKYILHPPEYPREFSDSGIQLIRSQNVRPFGISINERPVFFSADFLKNKKHFFAKKDDVLIVRSGVNAGNVAVIEENMNNAIIGADTLLCKCGENLIPKFLQVYFYTDFGKNQIIKHITGATNTHLNSENLKKVLVADVDVEIQCKAISIFEQSYRINQQKEAEATALLATIDSYLLQELGITLPPPSTPKKFFYTRSSKVSGERIDPFYHQGEFKELEQTMTKGKYEIRNFSNLITYISSGATPLKSNSEKYYTDDIKNGVPLLRVQNITATGVKLDDVIFINRETHEKDLKRSQVFSGDLLVTITGRIASSAIAPKNFEGNINQHSVIVRTNKNHVLNEYLAIYFNSYLGQKFALRKTTGGTRPALDYYALKAIKIPIPPPEKQAEIAEHIEALRSQAKQLQREAQTELERVKIEVERMIFGEKT